MKTIRLKIFIVGDKENTRDEVIDTLITALSNKFVINGESKNILQLTERLDLELFDPNFVTLDCDTAP